MIGLSIKDWGKYTKQMFHHTRPGGQVEIAEHSFDTYCDDGSVPENSPITKYISMTREGFRRMGLPLEEVNDEFIKKKLEEAGFVEVKVKTFRVCTGN